MTQSYPIRPITASELTTFAEVPSEAFLQTWPPSELDYERQIIEFDRTIAAFDGAQPVGTAGAHSFRLTVPGAAAAAAGITMVSVRPGYRRRGVLSAMMRSLLADAAERGEALAILFASESGIYRRFGFGLATSHLRLRIGRGEGQLAAGPLTADRPIRLRAAGPEPAKRDLAAVYEAVLPHRPGLLARDSRWWNYLLGDPEFQRDGMSPLRCVLAEDDSGPQGYALYRTKPGWGTDGIPAGTLMVTELMSTNSAATARLWSDLLNRDLVGEVIAASRPVDEPLLALLADPRRARPSLTDGLWVRLIDVPAALSGRRYAADVDLVLEVADPDIPANQGRWRLVADGPGRPAGPAAVSCLRATGAPDVRLSAAALGAAYLGGARLSQLAGAGQAAELTSGALARLSAAMSWDPAPWSCTSF